MVYGHISELDANMLRTTHLYHGFRNHINCTKSVNCTMWFMGTSELDANMLRTTHPYCGFRDHINCTKSVNCTMWFMGHISELGANVLVNSTHSINGLVDKILEIYIVPVV